MTSNGTIHPAPKLCAIVHDGEGGLRMTVHCHDGRIEVWPVTRERALVLLQTLLGWMHEQVKDERGSKS